MKTSAILVIVLLTLGAAGFSIALLDGRADNGHFTQLWADLNDSIA